MLHAQVSTSTTGYLREYDIKPYLGREAIDRPGPLPTWVGI
jgi:hypothetical protein